MTEPINRSRHALLTLLKINQGIDSGGLANQTAAFVNAIRLQ